MLVDRLGALTDPGYAEVYRGLLAVVEDTWPLVGWPLEGGEECRVGVVSTSQQLDELVSDLLLVIEENEATYPEGAAVTKLELGGIAVVRLDYLQAHPEFSPPSAGSHYVWVQDGTYYYVGCLGDRAPADRWLSIAETVEFLSEA